MLALAAVTGHGQDATASDRMVQAFRDYCINTDPTRIQAEVHKALGTWRPAVVDRWSDGTVNEVLSLSWTIRSNVHSRLILSISLTNGVPRACAVESVWPEKSEIVKALAASIVLSEATSALEGDAEVTRWTIRAHGAPAVVELSVPIYAAQPGRALTIHFGKSGERTGGTC
jgi:hypothetical protein